MLRIVATICIFALLHPSAHAADEGPCFSEGGSAQISVCLDRELQGADKLLRDKQARLIEHIQTMEVPPLVPEGQFRLKYINAIRTADRQWRALVATECVSIAPIEFEGAGAGSMGRVLELNCRVSRTYMRIKEIGDGDGYRHIWSQ